MWSRLPRRQHPITMATRGNGWLEFLLWTCVLLVGMSVASEARRRPDVVATPTSDNAAALSPWGSTPTVIAPTAVRKRAPSTKTTTVKPRPLKEKPRPLKDQKPAPLKDQKPEPSAVVADQAGCTCVKGSEGGLRPFGLGFLPLRASTVSTRTVTAYYANPTLTPVANTHVTRTHTVRSTFTSRLVVPTVSTSTHVLVTASYSTIVLPVFSTTTIVLPRTICL